ncbi:MAG: hypothetical protein WC994_00750 [Brumimicrobium sp.]
MEKMGIVYLNWQGLDEFQRLQSDIERTISQISSFIYIIRTKNPKEAEQLPKIDRVIFITKKDFSVFGKLRNKRIIEILNNEKMGIVIFASTIHDNFFKRILKTSKLKSVGIENSDLPDFDLSFKNIEKIDDNYFQQINKYLSQIQWK